MAAPISNDTSLKLDQHQTRGPEQDKAAEGPGALKKEDAAATPTGGDTLTLSETGRQLSGGEVEPERGPRSPEEAQELVARLKEKLAANPGFASAVHKTSDVSRLATLLDNYA